MTRRTPKKTSRTKNKATTAPTHAGAKKSSAGGKRAGGRSAVPPTGRGKKATARDAARGASRDASRDGPRKAGARSEGARAGASSRREVGAPAPAAPRGRGTPPKGLFVYGRHPALAELLHRPAAVKSLWCTDAAAHALASELVGHTVLRATDAELDVKTRGDRHQGIVVQSAPLPALDVTDIAPSSLILALDGVEDPRNLGRAARAAHAFGAGGLLVPDNHSAPCSGAAFKSAAGALSRLPVVRCTNLRQALTHLKEAGHWIFGAEADGTGPLWSADMKGRATLVIGGEDRGLRRLTREACDHVLSIPMASTDVSLNAADAASLFLYEWARQQAM